MRTPIALLFAVLSCRTAAAQTLVAAAQTPAASASAPAAAQTSAPAFELAAVNVSAPRASRRSPVLRGNRFDARAQTLPSLIAFAYGVNVDRVVGGPNWLDLDRFDVVARAPSGSSPEQQRQMVQALLADRFKVVIRAENRSQEAWALVLGKGPLQIKRSDGSDFTGCRGVSQAPGAAVIQEVECRNVTTATIATRLQGLNYGYFSGSVTDATGLTGTWNARFGVTPASARAAAGEGSSVFDAAESMGLKLERRDVPVPVLVVASVSQTPTPNARGAAEALAPAAADFELATVRPVAPGPGPLPGPVAAFAASLAAGPTIQPNGRILLRNVTVRDLVAFAWDVPTDMVFTSERFVDSDRFEIIGDAPAALPRPVDVEDVRPMVRSLLASRFALVVHNDVRRTDAWVLSAKREIKMTSGNDAERGACRSTPERIPPGSGLSAAITCTNTTMPQLVDRLQGMAPNYINGRPVLDETRLTGTYDFLVLWTGLAAINGRVNALQPGDKVDALAPVGSLTLGESLDRLGLKLTEEKRPMPALVIDRVQQPSAN